MTTESFFGIFAVQVSREVLLKINQNDLGSTEPSGSGLLFKVFSAIKGPGPKNSPTTWPQDAKERAQALQEDVARVKDFWMER
jgi:hypothetical protein